MKKKLLGFTLIEILLLIIVTGLLANTLLMGLNIAAQKTPSLTFNTIADQTAKQCIEWFIGQRNLKGYSTIPCPSTTVPAFCTSPAGYILSVDIACTTINTDTNYKTITVNVTGRGAASFTTLVAAY